MNSYTQTFLKRVFWGPNCLESALPDALSLVSKNKKALIITGRSLDKKTDVVRQVEKVLGPAHAGTFANIGQHAPIADIRQVVEQVRQQKADVLVAVGGGSPIDSAKAVAFLLQQENAEQHKPASDERDFLPIIAIPTTLSVAETTQNAGYTSEEGNKTGASHPAIVPRVIIYDAALTLATPERLWLSSGMRAVDHAIELLYRPGDSGILLSTALGSIRELFYLLPATKKQPENLEIRQKLQLACFQSLWPEGRKGALGLSHGLGHALGAKYAIPHGITSCLTLPGSIAITSQAPSTSNTHLLALSDALNFIPPSFYAGGNQQANTALPPPSILASQLSPKAQKDGSVGSAEEDGLIKQARARGLLVSQSVRKLVEDLGLHSTLEEYKVPKQDFETIAHHVTRGQDAALQQLIVAMLNAKYDDKPGHL
ncbi:Dehydroquinate synthase-like protein [Meira miltonrushii]|uniref:Dehydroquinate synthase-like protein n=1 Tax=Meira miltonrushii TaxID=1280837 RepID=A0A316VEE6_9BASI|nr:Dehydroquinate synthase-like protein [Meira miltonrushii]PWN35674.1 Dehydroquinate synthase-like protein [Meira miltonrushii]